jgi:two-component system LytT family sensor kinase
VKNKVNNDYKETKDKDSGIGLSNIRRRLELLYPENHSLTITNQDNWYVIELEIINA